MHTAIEAPRPYEISRGTEQHGSVTVVSTAMSDAAVNTGMRRAGGLADRQRIHIGAARSLYPTYRPQ